MFNNLAEARKAMREGDLIMAMAMYGGHLRRNPNDVHALNEAADCEHRQGLNSMAIQKLVRSLEVKPTPLAYWIMAKIQIDHWDRPLARDCLAKALALDWDFHYAHNTLAIMQIDDREPEAAIESSEAALCALARELVQRIAASIIPPRNGGRFARPHRTTGMLWNHYAKVAAVEIATKGGIEEVDWPADGYGAFEEGLVPTDYWMDYRPQQKGLEGPFPLRRRYLINFINTYLQLVTASGYGVMLYTKSRALKAVGRSEEAVAHEREAREFGVKPPAALTSDGPSTSSAPKLPLGIVFPGALEGRGRSVTSSRDALTKATAEIRARRWNSAIETLKKIDDPEVDQSVVHNSLGLCYRHLERYPEAIEHTKRSLEIQPSTLAINQMGIIYSAMGNVEEAIGYFKQAAKLDPDHPSSYNNLGIALYRQGRFLPACRNYQYALEATARRIAIRMVEEFGDRGPVNTVPPALKGGIWLTYAQYAAQFLCANVPDGRTMIWPKDVFGAPPNADPSLFWEDVQPKRKLWQRTAPSLARAIRPNFIATFFTLVERPKYKYIMFLKNYRASLEKLGEIAEAEVYLNEFRAFKERL